MTKREFPRFPPPTTAGRRRRIPSNGRFLPDGTPLALRRSRRYRSREFARSRNSSPHSHSRSSGDSTRLPHAGHSYCADSSTETFGLITFGHYHPPRYKSTPIIASSVLANVRPPSRSLAFHTVDFYLRGRESSSHGQDRPSSTDISGRSYRSGGEQEQPGVVRSANYR